jgi:hypothetical protein
MMTLMPVGFHAERLPLKTHSQKSPEDFPFLVNFIEEAEPRRFRLSRPARA